MLRTLRHYNVWSFYCIVLLLVVLNSLLLSSPNLLGKVGLLIYKYHYLRTFPRTLLTVSLVCAGAVAAGLLVEWCVVKQVLKKWLAVIILLLFIALCLVVLTKVSVDFTRWTYSHTGLRFRLGVYMLPLLLTLLFVHALYRVSRFRSMLKDPPLPLPVPPAERERMEPPADIMKQS